MCYISFLSILLHRLFTVLVLLQSCGKLLLYYMYSCYNTIKCNFKSFQNIFLVLIVIDSLQQLKCFNSLTCKFKLNKNKFKIITGITKWKMTDI